jgi:hypothetical protein
MNRLSNYSHGSVKLAIFSLGVIVYLFAPAAASSLPYQDSVNPNGETIIQMKRVNVDVTVEIFTHEIAIAGPNVPAPFDRVTNCTYSRYPCSLVDRVSISFNGIPLYVPRSVFADLADVDTGQIIKLKDSFEISLDCGDASESTIVKIYFDKNRVKSRAVLDPGSGYVMQETSYSKPLVKY